MKIEHGAIVVKGAILTPAEWNADMARFMRQWEQAVAEVAAITEEISSHKPPAFISSRLPTITEYIALSVAQYQYDAEEAVLHQRLQTAQDKRDAIEAKIIDLLPTDHHLLWGKYMLGRMTRNSTESPYTPYTFLVVEPVETEDLS